MVYTNHASFAMSILTILLSLSLLLSRAHVNASSVGGSNHSLLWGPYRPNLYFGVRPRVPRSLLAGLMWANVDQIQHVQENFRHTCEQHAGMAGYGWDEYDVRTGGRQSIHDAGNKIDITIEFVKMLDSEAKGGGWAARVKGTPREDAIDDLRTAVVFYAGLEGEGDFRVASPPDPLGQQGIVTLEGTTSELGDFKLDIISDSPYNRVPIHGHPSWTSKPLDRAIVSSMQVPPEAIWQAKNVMFANMKQQADGYIEKYGEDSLPPAWQLFTISNNIQDGNLHMLQKVYSGAFEFELVYSALDASSPSRQEVSAAIERSSKAFKSKFAEKIAPRAPFTDSRYATFAQSMFSNLVGGIGYFHGDFLVDRSYAAEFDEENEGFWEETAEARSRAQVEREGPIELFTSVPSRPFFPRGFLWDEGFHLIPIVEWDVDLTLEIVRSWLSLMDEDGWIAREQILGPEARSKVPPEFQVQYPHYANPPTLFLIVSTMIQNLDANKYSSSHAAELKEQIRAIYPLLKRHHDWFRKTQWGDLRSYDREATSMKEGYRWRGRTPRHILPSGLDDYPRAQPPHPGELHTDLISWTGMVARSLRGAAELLGEAEDASELAEQERAIIQNIDDLHWSSSSNTFCDATIDEYEESVHVCHKGYISIFPFLTGLLPANSPRLKAILDLIGDPEELWSDYGIRSLSRKDEAYGTDENYWKSPIWININYLIVKNLLTISQTTPPSSSPHRQQARTLYTQLRRNLVNTIYEEWKRTGFAWEQYDPETGQGQRTQHFTGWTSLVVEIMRMPDLSADDNDDDNNNNNKGDSGGSASGPLSERIDSNEQRTGENASPTERMSKDKGHIEL